MTFASRRWLAGLLTGMVAVAISVVVLAYSLSLHASAYLSGWLLAGIILFLASYDVRKKLTYPPLFQSSTWLQFHIYVGFLSVFLFLLHIGLRLPDGPFEITLALLFAGAAGSGVVGLVLSRAIPPRLAARGQEVLFERIPVFRRQLRDRAEQLVFESVERAGGATLANFYTARLADFFHGPRHWGQHLVQSNRPLLRLRSELRSLERYLNEWERQIADQLAELIEAKDALDYHYALQGVLKAWLFVHIPLTYVLLLFAVVHVVLVYAFSGTHGGLL